MIDYDIRRRSLATVSRDVLYTAQWQGLLAKIATRGGRLVKSESKRRRLVYEECSTATSGIDYIRSRWKYNEELLNEGISSVMMAMAPEALSDMCREVISGVDLGERAFVAEIEWRPYRQDIARLTGHPDICVVAEDHSRFLLIELKVRARASNGRLDLQQFLKYSALASLMKDVRQQHVTCALLVPRVAELQDCICPSSRKWLPNTEGRLTANWGLEAPLPAKMLASSRTVQQLRQETRTAAKTAGFSFDPTAAEHQMTVLDLAQIVHWLEQDGRVRHLASMLSDSLALAEGRWAEE